jgi:hypothetical protein
MLNPFRMLRGLILAPGKDAVITHIRGGRYAGMTEILVKKGVARGRFYTRDAYDPMALQFRASAGFPGSVTRMNPVTIEPCLIDSAAPPLGFGYAVMVDNTSTQGVRQVATTDDTTDHATVTDIYGIVVRSFPGQDPGAAGVYGASAFNAGTPPLRGALDILRMGYIIVQLNGSVYKGSPAHVWCAATNSPHTQGTFEAAATASSTIDIASSKTTYNSPADASGNVELALNI